MASFLINIEHPLDQTSISNQYRYRSDLVNLFQRISHGLLTGDTIDLHTSANNLVAASGTLTLVSAIATDAVTIGTVTLTASSTPANENQWEIDGADDTADAASLAAAINAHSVLGKVVRATSALGVVTVAAHIKGSIGNQIPISSADSTITASGAFLTSGTGGAETAAQAIEA